MVYYRLYHLRGSRNEVETFREFEAETDDDAIALGETWSGPNPMELWSGHRKVRRWEGLSSRISAAL